MQKSTINIKLCKMNWVTVHKHILILWKKWCLPHISWCMWNHILFAWCLLYLPYIFQPDTLIYIVFRLFFDVNVSLKINLFFMKLIVSCYIYCIINHSQNHSHSHFFHSQLQFLLKICCLLSFHFSWFSITIKR